MLCAKFEYRSKYACSIIILNLTNLESWVGICTTILYRQVEEYTDLVARIKAQIKLVCFVIVFPFF